MKSRLKDSSSDSTIIKLKSLSLSFIFSQINLNFHYNCTPFSSDIIDTFFNDFHPSPKFHTLCLSSSPTRVITIQ